MSHAWIAVTHLDEEGTRKLVARERGEPQTRRRPLRTLTQQEGGREPSAVRQHDGPGSAGLRFVAFI